MTRTDATAVIPALPGEVYAMLIDPARMDVVSEASGELVSDEELANGTRALCSRTPGPKGTTVDARTILAERVPDRRVVLRHTVAPTVVVSPRWLRFGQVEAERTLTLDAHPEGTLVRTQTGWRFRPILLHLYFAFVNRGHLRHASESTLERLRTYFVSAGGEG
jgi:hypothetical protein